MTDRLTFPFDADALAAIGSMDRGDVITYHCKAYFWPQHTNSTFAKKERRRGSSLI